MFGVRIANQLRSLGYAVAVVPTTSAFADRLRSAPAPVLGIVDMSAGPDWATVAALTADPTSAPILAFGPHTDVAARRAAKTAGVSRLISNGDFHRDMVALVRRYARPVPEPETDRPAESHR
jgi:hypothetical protein